MEENKEINEDFNEEMEEIAPLEAPPEEHVESGEPVESGEKHEVTAEMPGKVFKLVSAVGDKVDEGDAVIVIEAMKMEMDIASPATGTVTEILVKEGDQVAEGDVLAYVVG